MTELDVEFVFPYALTGVLTEVIGGFQIDVVGWDRDLSGPALVDDANQLFGQIQAKAIVSPVIEPVR